MIKRKSFGKLVVLLVLFILLMVSFPEASFAKRNPLVKPFVSEIENKYVDSWSVAREVKETARSLVERINILPDKDQSYIFGMLFYVASKALDHKDFCELFEDYRGYQGSKFDSRLLIDKYTQYEW